MHHKSNRVSAYLTFQSNGQSENYVSYHWFCIHHFVFAARRRCFEADQNSPFMSSTLYVVCRKSLYVKESVGIVDIFLRENCWCSCISLIKTSLLYLHRARVAGSNMFRGTREPSWFSLPSIINTLAMRALWLVVLIDCHQFNSRMYSWGFFASLRVSSSLSGSEQENVGIAPFLLLRSWIWMIPFLVPLVSSPIDCSGERRL